MQHILIGDDTDGDSLKKYEKRKSTYLSASSESYGNKLADSSGSSCRGLSYTRVSTIDPLELPKETLKQIKRFRLSPGACYEGIKLPYYA